MDHVHNQNLINGTSEKAIGRVHKLLNGTAASMGTLVLPGLAGSAAYVIEVITATTGGETIAITGKMKDNAGSASSALSVIDASTGNQVTSTNLASGTYLIPVQWPFNEYTFTKSAAVQNGVVSAVAIYYPAV